MIEKEDEIWATNQICEALSIDTYEECEANENDLEKILAVILDYAVSNGLCEDSVVYRDLLTQRLWGLSLRGQVMLSTNSILFMKSRQNVQLILLQIKPRQQLHKALQNKK